MDTYSWFLLLQLFTLKPTPHTHTHTPTPHTQTQTAYKSAPINYGGLLYPWRAKKPVQNHSPSCNQQIYCRLSSRQLFPSILVANTFFLLLLTFFVGGWVGKRFIFVLLYYYYGFLKSFAASLQLQLCFCDNFSNFFSCKEIRFLFLIKFFLFLHVRNFDRLRHVLWNGQEIED